MQAEQVTPRSDSTLKYRPTPSRAGTNVNTGTYMKLITDRTQKPLSSVATLAMAVAGSLLLGACGGGSGGDSQSDVSAAPPTAVAAVASESVASSPSVSQAALQVARDELLTQAMAESSSPSLMAPYISTSIRIDGPGSDTTDVVALAIPKGAALDTGNATVTTTGRATTYYINSKIGNDANNGLAASAGAGGAGPWRTFAKLAKATIAPGDAVRLECGSEWSETLQIPASGTSSMPIIVASNPANCANRPIINGGSTIAATSWQQHQGYIYKATLADTPLQLYSSSGYLKAAHHPNRGFDATAPTSLYLKTAIDSDSFTLGSRQVSSYVTTGSDLKLPAGAALVAGTTVRIRTNAWVIDERKITAISGAKLTLDSPTEYALKSGWGYYLLGQLWMLDSPGEWHYDASNRQIYAWMPDSRAPTTATVASQLLVGVEITNQKYIQIEGLAIKYVGVGINMRGTTAIVVRNSSIEDTFDMGADAAYSQSAVFDRNTFRRVGNNAISGQDNDTAVATGMQVLNNTINDSGVTMSGETVLSLPRRTHAAIRSGLNSVVSGNSVINAGNIGIKVMANSTVNNNYIRGACTIQDDCGAIYTSWADNNSTITNNLIERSRGAVEGKTPGSAYTQAQGIYLDESASGVTVSNNSVIDTDNGIQLHVSFNNKILNNKLYGNRRNQIWMQETRNRISPSGDVFGNQITGNQVVPTSASARGILAETQISSTLMFATYDWNKYFDRIYPIIALEKTPTNQTEYQLAQWRTATAGGTSRNLDVNGSGSSQTRFASILVNGSSFVPNGDLAANLTGWSVWNQTAPFGQMVRESCTPGFCARYVSGGSPGILTSPNFSIIAGKWYRLSVDIATGIDGQAVQLVVRRGGGGTNGYESLSNRGLTTTASRTWTRYSHIFMATKTINASDPVTKDLGARVDFQQIQPGQVVSVANLEIVPITPAEALTRTDVLVNSSAAAMQAECPVTATIPALCSKYVRLTDDTPIIWPHYLAARGTEIVYTRDVSLMDSDGDGIPDSQDRCANTAAGAAVNASGCALIQR